MTGQDVRRRKNAREDFRHLTDAEELGHELALAIRSLQRVAAKLIPQHEAECDARDAERAHQPDASDAAMGEALAALGRAKGRMFLERASRGLSARDVSEGSGWSEHTLRQFENREADAMVSSLFRYAAGLRASGVPGRIVVQWVPDEPAQPKEVPGDRAA